MTREEALEALKAKLDYYERDKRLKAACETLIPELCESESEDEKFRKYIIKCCEECIETNDKGLELSMSTTKRLVAYLKKEKDVSKAIEAVDRIDKYIDENVANAHDMKDSNPDKKYYCGWDAALGKMAGILQDVYSDEKQKEQEHNEGDFTIYHPLKNGKGEYECIPYSFYGSLTSFSEDKDLIDFLRTCFYTEEECNEWIKQQKEQKPAEWSEEDEEKLSAVISLMKSSRAVDPFYDKMCLEGWLKSLPERFNLEPKQEWGEEDEKMLTSFLHKVEVCDLLTNKENVWIVKRLKSLRPKPHWRPSEEQMDALNEAINTLAVSKYPHESDYLFNILNGLRNNLKSYSHEIH